MLISSQTYLNIVGEISAFPGLRVLRHRSQRMPKFGQSNFHLFIISEKKQFFINVSEKHLFHQSLHIRISSPYFNEKTDGFSQVFIIFPDGSIRIFHDFPAGKLT
jgi:hypothetical protein